MLRARARTEAALSHIVLRQAPGASTLGTGRTSQALSCFLLSCLALFLVLGSLWGCTAREAPSPLVIPNGAEAAQSRGRVSPVYEQWLYRQSLLGQARELLAATPAEKTLWRHTAALQDRELVRKAAPAWVVYTQDFAPQRLFASLQAALPVLASLSLTGVWLDQPNEPDTAWVPEKADHTRRTTSLHLDAALGSAEEWQQLVASLQAHGLQSGMRMTEAATGLGPDFMLQARGSDRHQGLYALWEVPERLWSQLPQAQSDWDVHPLDKTTVEALRREGILPPLLSQERLPLSCGWAATGRVLTMDGQTRRLVYRYLGTPWQPVLCWQDPSGRAKSLLAASVLQVTGLRRQTLCGVDVTGFLGLDVAPAPTDTRLALTPAPQVLADLSQHIRRYGGWSLSLGDGRIDAPARACTHPDGRRLDLALARAETDLELADFVQAPCLETALATAIRLGDASALADLVRRLARLPLKNCVLRAPSLKELKEAGFTGAADAGTRAAKTQGDVRSLAEGRRDLAHLLCALPAGLPGLAFLPADCVLKAPTAPARGKAPDPSDAGLLLADVLKARAALDLSGARLVKVSQPAKAVLVTMAALPGQGSLVTVLNFGAEPVTLSLPVLSGSISLTPHTNTVSGALSLKARQAAHFLVGCAYRPPHG